MVKAILHGCNGKMGRTVTQMIAEDDGIEIAAGIDLYDGVQNSYPVFQNIADCDVQADVIIDFANASAADALLEYSSSRGVPVVLCSTGLSDAQLRKVQETAGKAAVLKSANMSLGINMLLELLKNAVRVLAPAGFDIEIVRGGNIVGEHEVIFAGTDEVITFQHTAFSKAVFAKGAVEAAKFLAKKQPGMYDMADVAAAGQQA